MAMPDMSSHRKIDRAGLELLRCRRATNPTRVLLASVLGNYPLFLDGAAGEKIAHALGERGDVLGIAFLTALGRAIPSQSTSLGVGQTFLFRPCERFFFHQYTLPLVALTGTAKANHHRTERRVAAGSSSQRGISACKKHQVIEISAREAERPFRLHVKKAPLPELLATLRAD
jgi:hypothetical protein